MVCQKIRIRFRKDGNLRWISHHDLMRCFERMLRRAYIPFQATAGFNPKPRLIFALALPLGVVGCDEVADLELTRALPVEELRDRLSAQSPPGLSILSVEPICPKASLQVQRVCYCVPVPASAEKGLAERVRALLAAPACWVQRQRPRPRRVDVRPYINNIYLTANWLEMDLRVTHSGTARPQEIVDLLGLSSPGEAGPIVQRSLTQIDGHGPQEQSFLSPIAGAVSEPALPGKMFQRPAAPGSH
jgi:radical SAM-linked protein